MQRGGAVAAALARPFSGSARPASQAQHAQQQGAGLAVASVHSEDEDDYVLVDAVQSAHAAGNTLQY
jgi:hypothetical protein